MSFLVSSNLLAEEERGDCYTLIVFLFSCECLCSVSLLCSAICCLVVSDGGFS